MKKRLKKAGNWIVRNWHHLSGLVFLGSFALDAFAFQRIDLPWVNALFETYLVVAAVCLFLLHFRSGRKLEGSKAGKRTPVDALLLLVEQFTLGGILSGCFIFYFRSAVLSVSWPFLLLLGGIFFSSEFLRKYKDILAFQAGLLFFALYTYATFALPIAVGKMGVLEFLASSCASVAFFAVYGILLYVVNRDQVLRDRKPVGIAVAIILVVVNLAYFTGVLPPLPLALKDVGIYHQLTHTGDSYIVMAEEQKFNLLGSETLHVTPGEPLYAYSAVFAPIQLTTAIVHRWERYDDQSHQWLTTALVQFPIAGGRGGGYRGYSEETSVTPGTWRVSIETASGQVIGRQSFTVVSVDTEPNLQVVEK